MFHLSINLLSPTKKTRLKKIVQFLFIKEILEFAIFTCVLLAITHTLAGLVLTRTLTDLAQTSLLVNREFPSINNDIRAVNKLIKDIEDSSHGYSPVFPKVMELIDSLPPDIRLDSVLFNREGPVLSLSGVAETRDALLNYQKVLNEIPWIDLVSSPPSQLFQKDNIQFQFDTTLKDIPFIKAVAPKAKQPKRSIDQ